MFPPMTPISERIRERREMDEAMNRDPELLAMEREHWLSPVLNALVTRLRRPGNNVQQPVRASAKRATNLG